MASTLQLTGNRFILGIGAGWREDEYRAYGYEFPRPKERFEQLEETLQICRLMWTDVDPSFNGSHFQIDGASAPPLPEIQPPVCIGTSGEKVEYPWPLEHLTFGTPFGEGISTHCSESAMSCSGAWKRVAVLKLTCSFSGQSRQGYLKAPLKRLSFGLN